jgi:polyisoprenoid-binding protein YceI
MKCSALNKANMKYYFTLIALFISAPFFGALAQHYSPVEQGSLVQFKVVNHLIFKTTVTGTFKGLKGAIVFDPHNLSACSFNVSVAVETINTGIGMRNNDLQKEKYFNRQKYPLITIKSQSIKKGTGNNGYVLLASLTMKGVTKTISFPFTAIPEKGGYEFKCHFEVNRMDFNVGPDNSIDKNIKVDLLVMARP